MTFPSFGETLSDEHVRLLRCIAMRCRRSIIEMTARAQSGHPGGSLSVIDYLTLLYTFVISQRNEPVVVSNGHVSPAVYSILAELGVIPKDRVIALFRKPQDVYEGHVNRKVRGVHYSTGPLGVGGSVGAAFALGNKLKHVSESVYVLMGDGEQQEGQAYEMMNFASKYALSNLVVFIDYNRLQLSASLDEVMPIHIAGHYRAAGWEVLEVDGHDFQDMWNALSRAKAMQMEADASGEGKPVCIIATTVMGKGVSYMEEAANSGKASWHGNTPSRELADKALAELILSPEEDVLVDSFLNANREAIAQRIHGPEFFERGSALAGFQTGTPKEYTATDKTDCRSAYGNALTDLAALNPLLVAMTADLAGSVKTDGVQKAFPERHIECGISEQHMVSAAGGLSLRGFVPFCSTFGAFMSSRAKDQARVNDINETNVKMVATHCGISVGEDGPTHQAIDDIGSFLGFFHTSILEPADPNQCDRMIRAIASTYGNFYVRMGRAKVPVLTREKDGTPFFGGDYQFKIGKVDVLRGGNDATIVASGPMVAKALDARELLKGKIDVEVLVVSSYMPFDDAALKKSAKKTGRIVTLEDHNPITGLGSIVTQSLERSGLSNVTVAHMGVTSYQLSGTADDLYAEAGLTPKDIAKTIEKLSKDSARKTPKAPSLMPEHLASTPLGKKPL